MSWSLYTRYFLGGIFLSRAGTDGVGKCHRPYFLPNHFNSEQELEFNGLFGRIGGEAWGMTDAEAHAVQGVMA